MKGSLSLPLLLNGTEPVNEVSSEALAWYKETRPTQPSPPGRRVGDGAPCSELDANVTSGDMQHRTRLRAPSEMQILTRGPSELTAAVVSVGTRQPFCIQASVNLLLVTAAGDTCSFDQRRGKAGRWLLEPRPAQPTAVRGCLGMEELAMTKKT